MKILILGASGYLGNSIYKMLKILSNDEVLGTCYKSDSKELLQVNLFDSSNVEKLIAFKPDIIVWSIMDQEKEMLLSQMGLRKIIEGISKKVRFIYVSTTIGQGKDQDENIMPKRRNHDEYLSEYVNGKIEGEAIVMNHPNYVIIRPGSIYGYDYDGKMDLRMKGLFDISKIGEKYSRTANIYASFVNVQELAEAIIELIYNEFVGIINISGEKPVSHYNFNRHLARIMKLDDSFIIPDYMEEEVYHNLNNNKRKLVLRTIIHDI